MADEKLIKLVTELNKQTSAGKVAWESTDLVGVFQVSYPNYSIRISSRERNDVEDVFITIINSVGDVVESFSDVTLSSDFSSAYRLMSNTYFEARRIAMGVNAALDEILAELGLNSEEDEDIPF
ncbi:hypothetical protein [Pseudomonas syringae]|uniref:hypothetical protein n=1 Tax=Pseudomonas syringae TaxID=317 RepID=UPI000E30D825|nr:hypothetical protein [Pseudomonas syringae]